MAKEYLKNARDNSFNILREQGTFQNAFDFEFNNTYLPWIFADVLHLEEGRTAINNTIKILNDSVTQALAEIHSKAVHDEREKRRLAKEEKERLEKERQQRRQERAEARKKRDEENRRKALQGKNITNSFLNNFRKNCRSSYWKGRAKSKYVCSSFVRFRFTGKGWHDR